MTTGAADRILVNSQYTKAVFALTFRRLNSRGIIPSVLYPAVHIPSDADITKATKAVLDYRHGKAVVKLPLDSQQEQQHLILAFMTDALTFLSINRYERKKNISLAIQALAKLQKSRGSPSGVVGSTTTPSNYKAAVRLVVAGGYDGRVKENVEHAAELEQLAEKLGVRDSILFVKSFTDNQRSSMLAASVAVLYTPENEHFGIVPLEAGAAGKAVVACDSGGPLESVVDKKTGYLVQSKAEKWCGVMKELLKEGVAEEMGKAGRERVKRQFSRRAFGEELIGYCEELLTQ
jgi:alpha-1,3/alpha-1,6-mannosyltransferase